MAHIDFTDEEQGPNANSRKMKGELEQLRRMLEVNQIGTWEVHLPGAAIYLNGVGTEMLGRPKDEGRRASPFDWYRTLHPADRRYLRSQMEAYAHSDLPYFYMELRFFHPDKKYLWLRLSGETADRDETGNPTRLLGTFTLLNRRKMSDSIHYADVYEKLFQEDPLPRIIFDRETLSVLHVNQKAVSLYGYSREEWQGMRLYDFRPQEDIPRLDETLKKIPEDHSVKDMGIFCHQKKDEEFLYMDVYARRIQYRERAALLATYVNVTQSHLSNRLDQLESQLGQQLMQNLSRDQEAVSAYLLDLEKLLPGSRCSLVKIQNGTIQSWSAPSLPEAYNQAINGVPVGERSGTCGRAAALGRRVISEDLEQAAEWEAYLEIARAHGLRACWSEPIIAEKGQVVASLAFYRKEPGRPGPRELEMMEREARFLRLMIQYLNHEKKIRRWSERAEYVNRATRDIIYDFNPRTGDIELGEQFSGRFGHALEQDRHLPVEWSSLIHPEDREEVMSSFKTFLYDRKEEHWHCEYRLRRQDGEYAYVQERSYVVRGKNHQPLRVIGALSDITKEKEERAHLELLESVITHTNDAVLITEADHLKEPGPRVIYANEALYGLTGYSQEEIVGRSPRMFQGPLTDRASLDKMRIALQAGKPFETTLVNYGKSGTPYWVNMAISPVRNEAGKVTHFIAIERDVTERQEAFHRKERQAEIAAILYREPKLKKAMAQVLQYLMEVGGSEFGQFWVVTQNQRSLRLMIQQGKEGERRAEELPLAQVFKGEELTGQAWARGESILQYDLEEKETLPCIFRNTEQQMDYLGAFPLFFQDEVAGILVLGGQGDAQAFAYEAERMEALKDFLGEQLHHKKLEDNIGKIYNTAPNLICQADMEGQLLQVNQRSEEIFGLTPEQLQGRSCLDIPQEEERQAFLKDFWEPVINGKKLRHFKSVAADQKDETHYLEWSGQAVPEEGKVYLVIEDVTEKKLIEDLLDKATNLAKIGGWDYEPQKNQLDWTPMAIQIYEVPEGYQTEPEDLYRFIRRDYGQWIKQRMDYLMEKGESMDVEIPLITYKKQEKWVRLQAEASFKNGQCHRVSGSIQDIHDRKMAQLQLRQSNFRFEQVAEATSDAIWDWDIKDDQLHLGFGFQRLFGYSGKNSYFTRNGWLKNVHPEDLPQLNQKMLELLGDPSRDYWEAEYRYRRQQGDYALVLDRGKVLRDARGEAIRVVGAISDLTEYYQHLRAIEDQNNRLRDIAQTQSHQVRGPLASIMGLVQLQEQGVVEPGQEGDILKKIAQSAHKLDEVIRRIVEQTAQESSAEDPQKDI